MTKRFIRRGEHSSPAPGTSIDAFFARRTRIVIFFAQATRVGTVFARLPAKPCQRHKKRPGNIARALILSGWGRGIRRGIAAPSLRALAGPCALRWQRALALCSAPRPQRGSNPCGEHKKRPGNIARALILYGWGRGIRTPVTGTKNPGPAAGRCPSGLRSTA